MVQAPAVRVRRAEAEATRRRLLDMGALRLDLGVAKDGEDVLFPVVESCGPRLPVVPWDFEARPLRPTGYQDLLLPELRPLAPRAFDQVGDIVVVKVPVDLWPHRAEVGDALLGFLGARAAFHDHGVEGPFRVRRLERLAGEGDALTTVQENGVRLWVDLSRAYYSPRLAMERARTCALVAKGEHVADLFGGVAPFGVQAALRGATVDSVDLNPDAVALARRNVAENKVADRVTLHVGDARKVAEELPLADRILMNLPHGAWPFLDVAARLAKPRGLIHYHEILRQDAAEVREEELREELRSLGRRARVAGVRKVRDYSPEEAHFAYDLALE